MRSRTLCTALLLAELLSQSAFAQYGGGFQPAKSAPPAPTAPPPTPAPSASEQDDEPQDAPPAKSPDAPTAPTAPTPVADEEASKPTERFACTQPESGWLARLDPADRSAIDESLGWRIPDFSGDMKWVGATTSAPSIQGKVVVVQTFDVNSGGMGALEKAAAALRAHETDSSVVVIGVQVPNKVEAASARIAKSKAKASLCVDTKGAWCDAVGAFRKPVNFVVDKSGVVRYAGLSEKGLAGATALLLSEPPRTEPAAERPARAPESASIAFPTFTQPVNGANDLRGKRCPELLVDHWVSRAPVTSGKLIVVDFFFTGCPPCRAAIPHMNEIASHYGDKVAVVGVSWENKSTYESGLTRHKLKQRDFQYSIGLDSSRRTVGAFGVQSYPNVAVISADGIVRWQGHPTSLTQSVLDPLVAANAAIGGSSTSAGRGWVK
jgi:thiol-disulfide isomerase/thioredoxin